MFPKFSKTIPEIIKGNRPTITIKTARFASRLPYILPMLSWPSGQYLSMQYNIRYDIPLIY